MGSKKRKFAQAVFDAMHALVVKVYVACDRDEESL